MRKLAIAMALASTALATPAVARDQSFYVGIEGGVMLVEDTDFDVANIVAGTVRNFDDAVTANHDYGYDVDLIGGYDFGMVRVEGEIGYKRANIDDIAIASALGGTAGLDTEGRVRVWSAMAKALLDFGDDDGLSGFVGGGVGLANVRYKLDVNEVSLNGQGIGGTDSDRSFAWQAIAGIRTALSPNIDLGLKYRYFNVRKLDFDGGVSDLEGRFRSHSLLASLIFNFAPPPPPPPPPVMVEPPPPPPPPATQTCPDGSVILATDVCPAPPVYVPPPAPEPVPERG